MDKGGLLGKVKSWHLVLLLAGLCALYSLGVGTGYIFDDVTSLTPLLQLREDPDLFWPLVFGGAAGPLGRPVSLFTFALEQYFLSATPSVSQLFSIAVHGANSLLVFALLCKILRLEQLRHASFWAFAGAACWALAPQKVSTVLYIVQRMTMLSALLMLLAMLAYLSARLAERPGQRIAWFSLAGICTALAPFAKENGVLAVPLIAALEVFLLSGRQSRVSSTRLRSTALLILIGGGIAFTFVGVLEFLQSQGSYARRNFGYWDRLFASPEILFDYIKQFFFPVTQKMGLLHDDWQIALTAPVLIGKLAGTGVLLVSGFVCVRAIRRRASSALAVGCCIFIIGHSLESFFLPLELYFEHRNYLPSVGLALMFALGGAWLSKRYVAHGAYIVEVASLAYLFIIMAATANLASWWGTPTLLLQHHLAGHPDSSRVQAELALAQAKSGQFEGALVSIQRSYDLSLVSPAARSMGVLDRELLKHAAYCLNQQEEFDLQLETMNVQSSDPVRSASVRVYTAMLKDGVCSDANWDDLSDWMLRQAVLFEDAGNAFSLAALIDLANFETARANPLGVFVYASMADAASPGHAAALLLLAKAAGDLGEVDTLRETLARLDVLEKRGDLAPVERRMLQSLGGSN